MCQKNIIKNVFFCDKCVPEMRDWTICCMFCCKKISHIGQARVCGQCLTDRPLWSRLVVADDYSAAIQKTLWQFKYQRQHNAGRWLSDRLRHRLVQQTLTPGIVLVPIPLHHTRLKHRGFNQALEISKHLSRWLNLKIVNCCTRTKNTLPQHTLTPAERQRNLTGAFTCDGYVGRHVALVDDVITTGRTLEQAALACKQNGAQIIEAWCCAAA